MRFFMRFGRGAALAVACAAAGVLLAFGGSPAFALSLSQIYGSGASLQEQLQTDILIPNSGISPAPVYTSTTSGKGAAEWGFENGKLSLTEDPEADKADQLDAWIGQDSAPSSTQLANASTASGLSSNTVTVPVAQTALTILFALPQAIDINLSTTLNIPLLQLTSIFAGKTPLAISEGHHYPANTWGALLVLLGFTALLSGSPGLKEFIELGSEAGGTGGWTPLKIELRKNGAGTTLNLKQFLSQVEPSTWSSTLVSENSYPIKGNWFEATGLEYSAEPGNSTDANEVTAVIDTPGTIGYATLGDAVSGGFTGSPTSLGSYHVLYALLQDNGHSGSPIYASPLSGSSANVYTGSKANINGAGGVGSWLPPTNPYESWGSSTGSDPTVYEDAGETEDYYPLVSVGWDIGWLSYDASNLTTLYGASSLNAGLTALGLLEYSTSSSGQSGIASGGHYYAPLPSNVTSKAQKAAAAVDSGSK